MQYKKNKFLIFFIFNIFLLLIVLLLSIPAFKFLSNIYLDDNETDFILTVGNPFEYKINVFQKEPLDPSMFSLMFNSETLSDSEIVDDICAAAKKYIVKS